MYEEINLINANGSKEQVDDIIDAIYEMRRTAYEEGFERGRKDYLVTQAFDNAVKIDGGVTEQERRDEIVERAKADVEGLKSGCDGFYEVSNRRKQRHPHSCTAEFIVNKEKRTVVVLLRGWVSNKIRARGITKCHPNDCFNVHIGKAIALRRALGKEVPDEYLNAPQPTEVRVGDVVINNDWVSRGHQTVVRLIDNPNPIKYPGQAFNTCHEIGWLAESQVSIIDDSREECIDD